MNTNRHTFLGHGAVLAVAQQACPGAVTNARTAAAAMSHCTSPTAGAWRRTTSTAHRVGCRG